ncbi:MAG: riboflavin biosynthesis protein RibF, partial [Flammeovirgaceae bacterium]|nr:riboflavin biosynthesis protein RibF [Flammeovirgaceae bacterium]
MKIIKDNSTVKSSGYTIATIGYFDGIHLGHKKIINELVKQAKQKDGTSILITFWPHPRTVLEANSEIEFLLSNSEKIKFLEEEGLDLIYLIEFTWEFSKIEANDFIQNYLVEKLDIDKLVIGYNHNFGYKREGNYNFLEKNREKFEFDIQEIKKKEIDENLNISSSDIRK